ncbi:hypothetical protein M3J09_010042 [Ascochyta lentis]
MELVSNPYNDHHSSPSCPLRDHIQNHKNAYNTNHRHQCSKYQNLYAIPTAIALLEYISILPIVALDTGRCCYRLMLRP